MASPPGERDRRSVLLERLRVQACSHVWISLLDPPMRRSPYSPVIGSRRREMKHGATYHCQRCAAELVVTSKSMSTALLGPADHDASGVALLRIRKSGDFRFFNLK